MYRGYRSYCYLFLKSWGWHTGFVCKKFSAKKKTDRPPVKNWAMLVEAETFFCLAQEGYFRNAPINCKPHPTPRETMAELTASLCPEVGNLTTRWVTGVGHIDRRQSALWSPRVQGGAVWPFRLSPGGDLGYIWPPPWSNPHHLPGVTLGHAIDRCITFTKSRYSWCQLWKSA